jgi:hypothetical protein
MKKIESPQEQQNRMTLKPKGQTKHAEESVVGYWFSVQHVHAAPIHPGHSCNQKVGPPSETEFRVGQLLMLWGCTR